MTPTRKLPSSPANRKARRAAARKRPAKKVPPKFTLEFSLEEMGFLRILTTNVTVNQAVGKRLAASVQEKVEAHIGPLPTE